MKKFLLSVVLTIGLIFGGLTSSVFAEDIDQRDVIGSSYVVEVDGLEYTLSNFVEELMFGPYGPNDSEGTFEFGVPEGYFYKFGWTATDGVLTLAECLTAELTEEGIVIYFIPNDLVSTEIWGKVYMTPEEIPTLICINDD